MNDLRILIRPSGFDRSFTLAPPPSKSETHRAFLCAALAPHAVAVEHPLFCEDTETTLEALGRLGASWRVVGNTVRFGGGSIVERAPSVASLDCRSSASTLRLLLPLAALCGGRITFSGRPDLAGRPIAPLVEALRRGGAQISGTALPITVSGGLVGGTIEVPGDISSQFISGLLFALPLTERGGRIEVTPPLVSRPYVELTLGFLKRSGIEVAVSWEHPAFEIGGGQRFLPPPTLAPSGDWSSAAFWITAGLLTGPQVTLCALTPDTPQGDRRIVPLLRAMGGEIEMEGRRVVARRSHLRAERIDARGIPDLVPLLAVAATQARGTTTIAHTGRLRFKESDRIARISEMLGRMGAPIRVRDDAIEISGPVALRGATIDPGGDHRIVFAAVAAALTASGETRIPSPEAVDKSYPDFFYDLRRSGAVVLSETAPIGRHFQVALYGGSHEACIGVRIEGLDAGLSLSRARVEDDLSRRRPSGLLMSARREPDPLHLRRGLEQRGKAWRTTGETIEIEIPNLDCREGPYLRLRHTPRPGHGDYTAWRKYGGAFDFRGGGFLSARMTVGMVVAGAIARQLLEREGVTIAAYVNQIDGLRMTRIPSLDEAREETWKSPVHCPDRILSQEMAEAVRQAREEGDSLGGVVECQVHGLPVGIGEPIFHALDAELARYLFAIPAVKGVSFGAGYEAASWRGSRNNDPFLLSPEGEPLPATNHAGGVLGGISTGAPLIFQVAIKPTPSIARAQGSVDLRERREVTLRVTGRHDPAVVIRAPVIVEAFTAVALLDLSFAAHSPRR